MTEALFTHDDYRPGRRQVRQDRPATVRVA